MKKIRLIVTSFYDQSEKFSFGGARICGVEEENSKFYNQNYKITRKIATPTPPIWNKCSLWVLYNAN